MLNMYHLAKTASCCGQRLKHVYPRRGVCSEQILKGQTRRGVERPGMIMDWSVPVDMIDLRSRLG